MAKQVPEISAAEWEVMKTVWDRGPLTSGQIVQAVERERRWRPRTVKTLLARLVKKGAVGAKEQERKVLYAAKVPRDALIRRESRSFLSRVFNGDVAPALVHFLKDAKLSETEIDELKKILAQGRKP
jgi:BlaI family transcriptional regulator, penicillinase repressor